MSDVIHLDEYKKILFNLSRLVISNPKLRLKVK